MTVSTAAVRTAPARVLRELAGLGLFLCRTHGSHATTHLSVVPPYEGVEALCGTPVALVLPVTVERAVRVSCDECWARAVAAARRW